MSVDIEANPFIALVPISFQFRPPPNPPLPDARNREFHSVGKKRPKLKEELDDDLTLMAMAQSSGSPVEASGNGCEGLCQVPFAWTGTAYVILAWDGSIAEIDLSEHSRTGPDDP